MQSEDEGDESEDILTPIKSEIRTPKNKEGMTVYKQSLILMTKNVETDFKKS